MNVFAVDMLRLQFSLEAIDPINLPRYKGSAFHGGFGCSLEKISSTWFGCFFLQEAQNGNQAPKPFVLLPPLDEQQIYQAGETFQYELTLFGEVTQHYAIAQAAIEYLGRELGLGYSHGKFRIKDITESTFTRSDTNPQSITLLFITRLRLKANNRLQKKLRNFLC